MSDEVDPQTSAAQLTGEEQRDQEFFDLLRSQSTTKEQLINISLNRLTEIRLNALTYINKLKSQVNHLRLTNERLRTELAIEQSRSASNEQRPIGVTPNQVNYNNLSPTSSPIHNSHLTTNINPEKSSSKIEKPNKFSGNKPNEIDDWLLSVDRYLSATNTDESKWVLHAVSLLESEALSWWNSVERADGRRTATYSWNEFEKVMRDRYVPEGSETVAINKMSIWKQTGSIMAYIRQFRSFDQLVRKE